MPDALGEGHRALKTFLGAENARHTKAEYPNQLDYSGFAAACALLVLQGPIAGRSSSPFVRVPLLLPFVRVTLPPPFVRVPLPPPFVGVGVVAGGCGVGLLSRWGLPAWVRFPLPPRFVHVPLPPPFARVPLPAPFARVPRLPSFVRVPLPPPFVYDIRSCVQSCILPPHLSDSGSSPGGRIMRSF